jgi:cyclic pyranopterin phosphate synthase
MPFVSIAGGRIQAQKLEYNLVDHCNLSCRECSHLSPFLRAHALPLQTFTRDLTRLAQVYRVQRLRFVGGEPLLNDDICDFVAAARASGIAHDIEVVSNGVLLERVSDELLDGIDSLAVSLYPDKHPGEELLANTRSRCEKSGVRMRVEHIDRFRKTQTVVPIDDPKLLDGVFRSCLIAHAWSCQTIYDGRFYLCSRPILGTVGRYEPHAQLSSKERWRPAPPPEAPALKVDDSRLRALLRWQRISGALLKRLPSRHLSRALALAQTAFIGD